MRQPKTILVISLLTGLSIFFSRCFRQEAAGNDPRGNAYAGSNACLNCHKDIYTSYTHSNHYKTSSATNNDSLRKTVTASNRYFYFPDSSYITMEDKGGSMYQTSFLPDKQQELSFPFNIAFGSADKAQTYAYWNETKAFQLPLTYFTSMNVWANSPGFSPRHASFDRVIEGRCFECHSSFIHKEFVQSGAIAVEEKMDRNSVVYGIDCERCHGPGATHVQFHEENPSAKEGKYITSIKSLSRQQKLDVCATCHSGNDQVALRSLFAFMPGDTLSNFYYPDFGSGPVEPDVHGKQTQLLQSSLCYQKSDMTCITCHNSHEPEKNKMAVFISKCMSCHQSSVHAVDMMKENATAKQRTGLENKNCIDCHMPLLSSKIISFNSGTGSKYIPYFLRTHKIAVYKE